MSPTINDTDINISNVVFSEQSGDPATPDTSKWRLFFKAGGLYIIDDAGTVTGPLTASGGYTQGARVTHDVAQTLTNGAGLTLAFNTEEWDTDGIHSTSVNNSRLTCQTAGKYLVTASIEFTANGTGLRTIYITKNVDDYQAVVDMVAVSGKSHTLNISAVIDMAQNDYVTLTAIQTSGGNLDISSGATSNYGVWFAMQRIG